MTRKQPVILLLVIGIFAGYMIHNYRLQMNAMLDSYNTSILAREARLAKFLGNLKRVGESGNLDSVKGQVEFLRLTEVIDFYILHDQGAVLWYQAGNIDLKKIDKKYETLNAPVFGRDMTSISIPYGDGGIVLTVGIMKDYEGYYRARSAFANRYILEDGIVVFTLILLVSLWSLKDIRLLFSRIKSGDLKGLQHLQARSRESEMFMQGISGFAQSVDDLQHANSLLNKQILPSLKKEIFSGKKPPYDFNCTLVRIDINNFSTIYNSHDVTAFMQVINEFFVEVSHVVTRYGGLIHEFVGDEVIIYFKDEDHPLSFLIAVSAIRDVNVVAADFNVRTLRDFGYPFTVKSSLAHGRVRFGPLVNGYTVAGSVLIETVRILSAIHEKDGNVVYFDRANADRLRDVVSWRDAQTVKLKGFNGERVLCSYVAHRPLDDVLSGLSLATVHQLDFFRADDHLVRILRWLKAHQEDLPEKTLLEALMHLRGANLTKTTQDFGHTILTWCQELAIVTGAPDQGRRMRIASALVKLLMPLVPKEKFEKAYGDRMKMLMECRDRRVVANVIEVLTHFEVPEDPKVLEALEMVSDARIAANALVHAGREEVTRSVMKGLKRMVSSKDLGIVSSGLWALGEIAQHHRKRDYVYFSTQIDLKGMLQTLPSFVSSPHEAVRRQACLAAVKTAEAEILDDVKKAVAADPALSLELTKLFPQDGKNAA